MNKLGFREIDNGLPWTDRERRRERTNKGGGERRSGMGAGW